MTDSVAVFSPLDFVPDSNGNPVANGTIEFYVAGTNTPKTVYADSDLTTALGTTVNTNASGAVVTGGGADTMVYVGTDAYKIIVKNSLGATIRTLDNIKGAVSVPVTSEYALSQSPVITKSSNYSVTAADFGKTINCNSTGGPFAITLPTIPTAEDGDEITLRFSHNTTNPVTYRTTGTDTVGIPGQNTTAGTLKGWGQSVTLGFDGANWLVKASTPPVILDGLPFFKVADRLTTPPASPVGGARYIINGSPTGAWSTLGFIANQVVESNGNGSWFAYTPASGWFAYVADEDLFTKFDGTSWEDQTGMGAPSSSTLQAAVFEHSLANGTVGGTATTGAWTTRTLNTTQSNTITGVSLASNQITLPPGTYLINFWQSLHASSGSQSRIKVISGTATPDPILHGYYLPYAADSGGDNPLTIVAPPTSMGVLTVTATAVIELQYWVAGSAGGTSGLGSVSAEPTGSNEVYARVSILSFSALQGPPGPTGAQGVAAPRQNALINGAMTVAQQGTSFTGATSVLNNDGNYTLDGWVLLSDGNNIVNVAQSTDAPTGGLNSLSMTVATVNKKFGIFQPVERKDALGCIGATCTVSFKMKASSVTNLDNVRVAIVAWSSTADSITRDIVSAWNAEGTNPTLVANWTYENTPTTITPTTSWATYSVSAAIDTASTTNIGVFIWSDVTTTTLTTDVLYITEVQLEPQTSASTYLYEPHYVELGRCQRQYQRLGGKGSSDLQFRGYQAAAALFLQTIQFPTPMRTTPTATIVNSGSWTLTNLTSLTVDGATDTTVRLYGTASATGACILSSTNSTTYIDLDARL